MGNRQSIFDIKRERGVGKMKETWVKEMPDDYYNQLSNNDLVN